jgi:hypothetical protein
MGSARAGPIHKHPDSSRETGTIRRRVGALLVVHSVVLLNTLNE